MSDENETDVMDEWAEAMAEAGAAGDEAAAAAAEGGDAADPGTAGEEVAQAELETLEDTGQPPEGDEEINLDVILDVPVTVSMEIGHTKMNIRNLLQLNQGSVVELDRLAGEPLDVLVNGTLIAHGEVVVVNEKFGIRLTDIISPSERVRKLG